MIRAVAQGTLPLMRGNISLQGRIAPSRNAPALVRNDKVHIQGDRVAESAAGWARAEGELKEK